MTAIPHTNIRLETELAKLRDILRRPRYALITLLTAGAAYALYAILLNYQLVFSTLAQGNIPLLLDLLPALILGYSGTTTGVSLLFSALISLAIGVNAALVVFRLVELSDFGKEGASSIGGMAVAVLAPACPACATALFAVSGLSSALALLPFKGTELKVLALLLLAGSAVWITSQIHKDVCEFC